MKKRRPCADSTSSAPTSPRYLPVPGAVADDDGLGVEMGLQLQQRIAASGGVRRHRRRAASVLRRRPRPFAPGLGRARPDRRRAIAARPRPARAGRRQGRRDARDALGEAARRRPACRRPCSEPRATRARPARRAGRSPRARRSGRGRARARRRAAPRQRGEERRRRRHGAAAAMAQDAAVPERAHAVVLLAHEAARRIDLAGIDLRQLRRQRDFGRRREAASGKGAAVMPGCAPARRQRLPCGDPQHAERTSAATATSSRRRSIDDDEFGMTGLLATRRQRRAPILASAARRCREPPSGAPFPHRTDTHDRAARRGRRLPLSIIDDACLLHRSRMKADFEPHEIEQNAQRAWAAATPIASARTRAGPSSTPARCCRTRAAGCTWGTCATTRSTTCWRASCAWPA